ncbi:hypothetical protein ACOMHN_065674 [Nucella lapillus]
MKWVAHSTRQAQLLSKASDNYTPTRLWQLDSGHHGQSSNTHTLYAILHQVQLQPGPFNNTYNSSLSFQGTSSSYVNIPNSAGDLNATDAFSWVLLIKPTKTTSDGVILEYWDGTGGLRLKQEKKNLVVEALDTDNDLNKLTKTNILQANVWKFVTVTFMGFGKKKFKLIFSDYDEQGDPSGKEEMGVNDGTVLRGTGDVRLGASVDPTLPAFSGNIGCLRYYKAYIAKFQDGYALSCDPSSGLFSHTLDNLSENTIDYVERTTALVMTTTAAQETTEERSTERETLLPTTDSPQTIPMTTRHVLENPTTASVSACAAFSGTPCGGIEMHFTEATCVRLLQETGMATFSSGSNILTDIQARSLNACAGACASTTGCKAIAIEKKVKDNDISGRCILGGSGYSTAADTQFYLYHVTG